MPSSWRFLALIKQNPQRTERAERVHRGPSEKATDKLTEISFNAETKAAPSTAEGAKSLGRNPRRAAFPEGFFRTVRETSGPVRCGKRRREQEKEQEEGSRNKGAGRREQEREQEEGSRNKGAGKREQEEGNRKKGAGIREQEEGNRKKGTGRREQE
ncbi:hypothetical protein NHX12_007860 [Muraenolepis orangiensis]|uniref:Uncharacterized protein n=1 Tax=Muraenolepis orangiensis TaxID=630683 RepID=A0A9Q0DQT8_9TELE|nr:hypothetical protein NHX12_007860 [Muraenolepis orangiensis]